jgi:hypothetical protein
VPHSLILSQLDGSRIRIILDSTASPEEQLEENYRLLYNKQYYPGNDEPTVQILNRRPETFTIKGLLSDREARVPGFADTTRQALLQIAREAHPVALYYRDLSLRTLLTRVRFRENNRQEIAYELELDPNTLPLQEATPGAADEIYTRLIEQRLQDALTAYEELPDPIRIPPTFDSPYLLEDLVQDTPPIAPVEFIIDPWLEFRLSMAAVHRAITELIRLAGNETLINLNDSTIAIRDAAVVAVGRARTLLDAFSPDGNLIDQLAQVRNVSAAMAALIGLRLALR